MMNSKIFEEKRGQMIIFIFMLIDRETRAKIKSVLEMKTDQICSQCIPEAITFLK